MLVGLPILANTAAFGAVVGLDRVLILWRLPDADRCLGLYTIAIMGTSWSLDLAGRIVTVVYTYLQATFGKTSRPAEVTRQAMRATEAQAPVLAAGSAVAYLVAPAFLGMLMPRFVDGLPALRPLLPGTLFLGLAWPFRQLLITLGKPYTLALATLAGLAIALISGLVGADTGNLVGLAWGISVGYAAVAWITGASAVVPILGWAAWWQHQYRLACWLVAFALATLATAHLPLGPFDPRVDLALRCLILAGWLAPAMLFWGWSHNWAGLDRLVRRRLPSRLALMFGSTQP